MRRLLLLAAVAAGLFVAGCNTVAGVGRDVSALGRGVTNTANDVSH